MKRIKNIVREMDVIVHTLSSHSDTGQAIKLEVGIEEALQIEFEYDHLKWVAL